MVSILNIIRKVNRKENKEKQENIRCRKYEKWGNTNNITKLFTKKEHCKGHVYRDICDEWEWVFCKKHGCKICGGEIKESDRNKKQIEDEFFVCGESACQKVLTENSDALYKIIAGSNDIKEKFFAADKFLFASDWGLKELVEDLRIAEQDAILWNIEDKPIIRSSFLERIKDGIIGTNKMLTVGEKEILKGAYIEGNSIENTMNEKLEAFAKILGNRTIKRNFNQKKEDLIMNCLKQLDGWNLLGENEKQYLINEIKKQKNDFYFNTILNQAKDSIKRKKENENRRENPPNLPSEEELSSTKQGIQIKYNLDLAEFNLVLEPITDLEVLEAVDKLVGKVKMGTQDTDLDSLYEILRAYQQATDGSLKNKAYLAVNSYQQQVDQLISSLETKKNKRKSSLQELVQAKDETELNQVYQAIKEDPELYQAQNQNLIDNHQKRVVGALQIMVQNPTNGLAQELVTTLRTIVASDSDQDDLINLAQKIKEYQTAHGGEKEELYQQHHSVIDQMEQEIQTELTRRQQSEEEQRDKPSPSPSTTSQPASGKGLALFLLGLGGIATLLVLSYLYKKKKKTDNSKSHNSLLI